MDKFRKYFPSNESFVFLSQLLPDIIPSDVAGVSDCDIFCNPDDGGGGSFRLTFRYNRGGMIPVSLNGVIIPDMESRIWCTIGNERCYIDEEFERNLYSKAGGIRRAIIRRILNLFATTYENRWDDLLTHPFGSVLPQNCEGSDTLIR